MLASDLSWGATCELPVWEVCSVSPCWISLRELVLLLVSVFEDQQVLQWFRRCSNVLVLHSILQWLKVSRTDWSSSRRGRWGLHSQNSLVHRHWHHLPWTRCGRAGGHLQEDFYEHSEPELSPVWTQGHSIRPTVWTPFLRAYHQTCLKREHFHPFALAH